jgi:replicative DNA helicase
MSLVPPQATEAEQSLLGSMMLDNRIVDDVSSILDIDDFYTKDHKTIFAAIKSLSGSGGACDLVTVGDCLKSSEIEISYLDRLCRNTPYSGAFKSYAKIVRDKSVLRKVIECANDGIAAAYEADNAEHVVDDFAKAVSEITFSKFNNNNLAIKNVLDLATESLEEKFKRKEALAGMSTGFLDIDKLTNGLQGGKLVVVAGRPSMGKTTIAMNMCEKICGAGGVVQIFTLEMPNAEIGSKILSSQGGVDYGRINKPINLENDDWPKLTATNGRINDTWKMFIDDSATNSLEKIRSTCRNMKREHGLNAVMIDYLQLMDYPKADRVDLSVGAITKALKALSKELDVPIILLSQLNRGLEQRPNKRPVMSDLKESGAIEQDADLIMFVYRHEMYEPETDQKGVAEIIFAKNRQGKLGTVRLLFRGELQRFENYSYHNQAN